MSSNWSDANNWYVFGQPNVHQASQNGDDLQFGNAAGSSTDDMMNLTVNNLLVSNGFSAAITIASGKTLTASYFSSYGTLNVLK